jgi:hypothetical protein
MSVFVLDRRKHPLMPCTERRARLLLGRGRAVVVRAYPFTIRLKDCAGGITQPVRIKIDSGSKTTGIAMVRENGQKQHVLALAIKATGRGRYKRTRLTKHGFPRSYLMRQKKVQGFQTGDMVRARCRQARKPTSGRAGSPFARPAASTSRHRAAPYKASYIGISH